MWSLPGSTVRLLLLLFFWATVTGRVLWIWVRLSLCPSIQKFFLNLRISFFWYMRGYYWSTWGYTWQSQMFRKDSVWAKIVKNNSEWGISTISKKKKKINYLAAPRPTLCHYRGKCLTHPMLITAALQFWSEGHWKPCNEVGFLSPGECQVGFEPRTFRLFITP